MKLNFLRTFLPYKKGVPSKSTISRVLSLFDPKLFEELLVTWMKRILSTDSDSKHVAIDGKTHRGVIAEDHNYLHLVNAYSVNKGLVLAQEKVADKSNEITAIPLLLEALHITGQVVSIDAMGCQKNIVNKIRHKKIDYVLALKDNQGQLHDDIKLYFESERHLVQCNYHKDLDKGHGRHEQRECYATENISWLDNRSSWKDLKSIVMVRSTITTKQHVSNEVRYFISSLRAQPLKLLQTVRAHWGIESMHWCLDVIFLEDDRIIWNRNFARNESIIRRLALNLLKQFRERAEYTIGNALAAIKSIRKLLVGNDDKMSRLIRGLT